MIGDGTLMLAALRILLVWLHRHAMGVALALIIGGYAVFAVVEVATR